MRIIYSSSDPKQTSLLSNFLKSKGIENLVETSKGGDWGSPDYGVTSSSLWVIEEDTLDEALKWSEEFKKNPNNSQFLLSESHLKSILEPLEKTLKAIPNPVPNLESNAETSYSGMGFITLYIMISCILLFLYASMTIPEVTKLPRGIPFTPVVTAPINKMLMYDYPKAYEIIDQVVATYGIEKIQNPETLPPQGVALLNKFFETPYWQGLYDQLILSMKDRKANLSYFTAPLFEKIKEGEVWRAFTPALMHASFFHIVFNLILFVILGKQMENKIGSPRYLLFILLAGIVSNTAQYLMTGTSFLGISGVVCAMIGFIFVRQKIAAWEGYQFSSVSLSSVFIFIMLMFVIQIISYFTEIYLDVDLSPGIANTAHMSGLLFGMLLGLTNVFKLKNIQ